MQNVSQTLTAWKNRVFEGLYGADIKSQRVAFCLFVIGTTIGTGAILLSGPQTLATISTRIILAVQYFGAWQLFFKELSARFGQTPPGSLRDPNNTSFGAAVWIGFLAFLVISVVLEGNFAFGAWLASVVLPLMLFVRRVSLM